MGPGVEPYRFKDVRNLSPPSLYRLNRKNTLCKKKVSRNFCLQFLQDPYMHHNHGDWAVPLRLAHLRRTFVHTGELPEGHADNASTDLRPKGVSSDRHTFARLPATPPHPSPGRLTTVSHRGLKKTLLRQNPDSEQVSVRYERLVEVVSRTGAKTATEASTVRTFPNREADRRRAGRESTSGSEYSSRGKCTSKSTQTCILC